MHFIVALSALKSVELLLPDFCGKQKFPRIQRVLKNVGFVKCCAVFDQSAVLVVPDIQTELPPPARDFFVG